MAFQPRGSRAIRVIIAEIAAQAAYGDILPFGALAAAIGADDGAEAGRAKVRQAVSAARPLLLRDHNRALVPARGQGYRVAYPGEFAGIAQDHRRRSDRSLGRALATVEHAPVGDMTPAERKRNAAVATVLNNVVRRMTDAEKRLADLEAVVYGPPRRAKNVVQAEPENLHSTAKRGEAKQSLVRRSLAKRSGEQQGIEKRSPAEQSIEGERRMQDHSKSCGCRYVRLQGSWWQVVACPDHALAFRPLDEVPGD